MGGVDDKNIVFSVINKHSLQHLLFMASLESKLLGEKKHNYASSSEDEDDQPTSKPQPAQPSSDGLPQVYIHILI